MPTDDTLVLSPAGGRGKLHPKFGVETKCQVAYNRDGSVASTTENRVITTFTYNTDGTVNTQTRAGVTKTFTYDANGNVTGAA